MQVGANIPSEARTASFFSVFASPKSTIPNAAITMVEMSTVMMIQATRRTLNEYGRCFSFFQMMARNPIAGIEANIATRICR